MALMQFALCYAMMPLLAMTLGQAFGIDKALLAVSHSYYHLMHGREIIKIHLLESF